MLQSITPRKISKLTAKQIIPENILFLQEESAPLTAKSIEVDPTDTCNHGCYFCFTKTKRKEDFISPECLKAMLQDFVYSGGVSLHFSGGGDPLLYKYLYSPSIHFEDKTVLDYLLDNNIAVGLITNGYNLHKLSISTIKRLAFIRISLDSSNEIEYSKVHGCPLNNYVRVVSNIKNIINARSNSYSPAIGLSFVVDPNRQLNNTKVDIEKICVLVKELPVDFVQIKHIHTDEKKSAQETMIKIHEYCTNFNWHETEFWVQHYIAPEPAKVCQVTQYIKVIARNGNSYPCCHLFGENEFLDNTNSLKGEITRNCISKVCRYSSINHLLADNNPVSAEKSLQYSLDKHGFHPYRLFPSAPDIFEPFSMNHDAASHN